MDEVVFERLLFRAKEYCDNRPNHKMSITFHGGEPTLLGSKRFSDYVRKVHEILGSRLGGIIIQTNGTLLDENWIKVFKEWNISVGVSIDGSEVSHNMNRIYRHGGGSHSACINGYMLLRKAGLKPGITCVINPASNGLENYLYFRSLGAVRMNFLFPDATWESKKRLYDQFGPTPVANYLIPIFDKWFADDNPDIQIRILWSLISKMMGGSHNSDAFGNPQMDYLIIETDGSIQTLDSLRVCEEGIDNSGLNVLTNSFDDLQMGVPFVNYIMSNEIPLCIECQKCPEVDICGGGHLPHRYSKKNGFNNPSVWCKDILKLLSHIRVKTGLSNSI
jgi:uncharacterized protein